MRPSADAADVAGGRATARAVVAAVGLVVAGVLPCFLMASVAGRMRADFSFGPSTLGIAVAVFHLASAAAAPPAGRVVARIGARRALRAAAAASASAALAIALIADSVIALLCLLVIAGVANGAAGPVASSLLRSVVGVRRRGLAFGAQQAGVPAGLLLAGLALPLVAMPFGWRWSYAMVAAVALTAAVCVPRITAEGRPGPGTARIGRAAVEARRPLRLVALAAGLGNAAATGVVAFLVVFGGAAGMTEAATGLLLSGVSIAAIAGRVGIGLLVDRRRADPLAVSVLLLLAAAVGALLLIPAEPALIVVGAVLLAGLGWAWPGLFTLAAVAERPDAPASAVGVMMSGLLLGAVAGPLLVGALAAGTSYETAWLVCALLAGLAAATVQGRRAQRRDALRVAGPSTPENDTITDAQCAGGARLR